MDKEKLTYLIKRYRSGTATPEEVETLIRFWHLAQTDDSAFLSLTPTERDKIRKTMFAAVRSRIDTVDEGKKWRWADHPVLSCGIGIAMVIACVFFATFFIDLSPDRMQIVRTAYGERRPHLLPDGSYVMLNGNSSLKFNADWASDGIRQVWIEGEALFDVVHTSDNRPFIVHIAGGIDVNVLGTRFNVKMRKGTAEVLLQEGRVALKFRDTNDEEMTLDPGELVTVRPEEITREVVEVEKYLGWTNDRLYLDQTSLQEVGEMLEYTYGLKVTFSSDSLAARKVSGEIASSDVKEILLALQEALDVKVIRHESEILITNSPQ